MKERVYWFRLISLLLVSAFMIGILAGCGKKTNSVPETQETTLGIDVARYQGTIDWQAVASSGVEFAMVRVGYRAQADGLIKEDPNARYNLQELQKPAFLWVRTFSLRQ